jgi:branched-chain amino acid transport system ATP-binding protein
MLRIEGLSAGYDSVVALRSATLELPAKAIVTVIGANGAGKSTLLNAISHVVDIYSGSVTFAGEDITRLSAPDVVGRGIIQVPEGRQLFGSLTVEENLRVGFHRLRSHGAAKLRERFDYVYSLFPWLKDRLHQRAVTLSGGQQQMVALGRALMAEPKILLLDEPSLGLAPIVVDQIFDILKALREQGITMLLVEQHADAALALADYAYVLATGSVAASGPAQQLKSDPRIAQLYLGAGGSLHQRAAQPAV